MVKIVIDKPYTVRIEDLNSPILIENSAMVRVKYVGICGSDLLKFIGKYHGIQYPVTPGHEFTGVIEKVSENTFGFQEGDHVVVNPNIPCGTCYYCHSGRDYLCNNLITLGAKGVDGAMQERLNVPIRNLVKVDHTIELAKMALTEPLSVAIHAIRGNNIGEKIVLLGFGSIGTLLFLFLKSQHENIAVIEVNKDQIEYAKSLHIPNVFDYRSLRKDYTCYEETYETIVINCPFSKEVFDLSLDLVERGGKIIVIGLPIESIVVDFIKVIHKEAMLIPCFKNTRKDFRGAYNFLQKHDVLQHIKLKIFTLNTALDGFQYKAEHPECKVLLENTN